MIEFLYWFLLMLFSYFIVLFCYMHFSYKKEVLNNFLGFSALFLTFLVIVIVELLMFQDTTLYLLTIPIFFLSLGLIILIIGAIVLISSVLLFLFKKIFKEDYFQIYLLMTPEVKK